jgi:hypothetical protein
MSAAWRLPRPVASDPSATLRSLYRLIDEECDEAIAEAKTITRAIPALTITGAHRVLAQERPGAVNGSASHPPEEARRRMLRRLAEMVSESEPETEEG